MATNIDKRKNIIISLKSNYTGNNKGIDKKIQYLGIMSILNISLSIICGGMILISIISEQFGFEILKWEKLGITVLLSITFFLNFPNEVYEYKMLKHFKRINDFKDFPELEQLNIELKNLIDKLNKMRNLNMFLIGFIILILMMGLWQTAFENNPFWIYMKIPIFAFYGFIIAGFIKAYKKLSKNIKNTENAVANNS